VYPIRKSNKHALPITTTKLRDVQFSLRFLLVVHHRFATATWVLLCKLQLVAVGEHENKPNNTHTPYKQWLRLKPSYEFHFEGLSNFSCSVEGLV
jgi:hypothetical protein